MSVKLISRFRKLRSSSAFFHCVTRGNIRYCPGARETLPCFPGRTGAALLAACRSCYRRPVSDVVRAGSGKFNELLKLLRNPPRGGQHFNADHGPTDLRAGVDHLNLTNELEPVVGRRIAERRSRGYFNANFMLARRQHNNVVVSQLVDAFVRFSRFRTPVNRILVVP